MKSSFKSVLVGIMALVAATAFGQITSLQDGDWNDPDTWSCACEPDSSYGTISITHEVTITSDITIDQTTVQNGGLLIVNAGVVLTINNDVVAGIDFTVNGALQVEGEFILTNGATHAGMTSANTSFLAGSVYRHQFITAQGVIPLASWDPASNVVIEGYASAFTASVAGNWSQNFGDFTWNCTAQGGVSNLAGLLTSMRNVEILSTGTSILRLSVNQNPVINIAGNLTIAGTSRVDFSTTGTNTEVNVGGNIIYTSTNAAGGGSRLTTTGSCTIDISGDFSMNAPGGQFNLSAGAGGSGTLNISGDLTLDAGTITETGGGASRGYFVFTGNGVTHLFENNGQISNTVTYSIPVNNTLVAVGESQLRGTANSLLTVDGTLVVQSENGTGAIFTGAGTGVGNVRVTNRVYNPGAVIIYGGTGPQFIGNGQPAEAGITTIISNASGVSLNNTTSALVTIGGDLDVQTGNLTVSLDGLTVDGLFSLSGGNVLFTTAGTARTLTANGTIDLAGGDIVVTSGTANANLIINGDITGGNFISFSGANSNLTINGSGDLSVDFPIPGSTTLETLTLNRGGDGLIIFPEELLVTATAGISIQAGSMQMNANLTCNGNLNINSGSTLFFEGQTLELRGQFNNNLTGGSLSSDETSTLNLLGGAFTGTLAFSPGNTLGTFLLNRTGAVTVTLNSPLTVENVFYLQDGNFLNTSGLSFGNGADVTRFNTAAFSAGSAIPGGGPYNLFYEGTALTTGVEAQGSLESLTSNASGTVTVSTAITVNSALNVNSGTFACGANNITTNTLTMSGILNAQTSTITFTGTGNFINDGTFNRNTGTVRFNGVTSISGSANPSFQNVIINGTLNPPGTFTLHGAFTNNGLFNNGGSGTVVFSGTAGAPQIVSGTAVTNFHNIDVTNTTAVPDVIIESNQNMTGVLTLNATATFDADGAGDNRIFTLISTDDDPTQDAAIAILPATSAVQGNVTVQRYMSLEGTNDRLYRYISSPVQNATVADIQNEIPVTGTFTGRSICSGCLTNPSMFWYNESVTTGGIDDGYVAFPVSINTETLDIGRGYAIFIRGNINPILSNGSALWDVRGPVNRGTINYGVTFTSSGNAANDGWNLVGNPYPSTIDWEAPNGAAGWSGRTRVSNTIYIRDNATGQFATYTRLLGPGGATNGGSRYIAMGQGFWIQTVPGGGSPSLISTENVKVAGQQTTFFREMAPFNIARLALLKGTIRDEAVIHFSEEATAGFDYHADGWKLDNATINLSSIAEGVGRLAVNSLGEFNCNSTVRLDVSGASVTAGNYSLEFSHLDSFDPAINVSLIDAFTQQEINMRTVSSYAFQVTSDPLSKGSDRFSVRFAGQEVNDFTLNMDSELCKGNELQIVVNNSQAGVYYQAFNGVDQLSSAVQGTGGNLILNVSSNNLSGGDALISVKANAPGCSISKSSSITISDVYSVSSVQNAERCLPGRVTLSIVDPSSGLGRILWYDTPDAITSVGEGAEFQTPELVTSKTYYASVANNLGCEGNRVPVQAVVHNYEQATIGSSGNTLISNHLFGNQWMFNGVDIPGATGNIYEADQSGLYALRVSLPGGCTSAAERQFVVTGLENDLENTVKVFPNPTKGKLLVEVQTDGPVSLRIYDVMGVRVAGSDLKGSENIKRAELDLTGRSDGMYILHVLKGGSIRKLKIIKGN